MQLYGYVTESKRECNRYFRFVMFRGERKIKITSASHWRIYKMGSFTSQLRETGVGRRMAPTCTFGEVGYNGKRMKRFMHRKSDIRCHTFEKASILTWKGRWRFCLFFLAAAEAGCQQGTQLHDCTCSPLIAKPVDDFTSPPAPWHPHTQRLGWHFAKIFEEMQLDEPESLTTAES